MPRYSYEPIAARPRAPFGVEHGPPLHFRIRDEKDNRVATCWDEDNARLVVMALNFSAGDPCNWVCGHHATAVCAQCHSELADKAHELAEENFDLRGGEANPENLRRAQEGKAGV